MMGPVTRRLDVDFVRAIALVSMYVAHVAPSAGPANLLLLSEYLTMPLFALIVGVGAELGVRRAQTHGEAAWARSLLVRAVALVLLGIALEQAGARVLIVLVHLGVLLLVAGPLSRLPSPAVLAAGAVAFVVAPLLYAPAAPGGYFFDAVGLTAMMESLMFTGYAYRVLTMVVYAAIGIVLARRWLRTTQSSAREPLAVGVGALVGAVAILVADMVGVLDVHPYAGTHLETFFDALLVTGTLGIGLWLAHLLPDVAVRPVAVMGAMTLTLYSLQILWLAYDVRVLHPMQSDDTWTNLAILTLGSLVIATAWMLVVRRGLWRRGPIEGVVALLSGSAASSSRSRVNT